MTDHWKVSNVYVPPWPALYLTKQHVQNAYYINSCYKKMATFTTVKLTAAKQTFLVPSNLLSKQDKTCCDKIH